MTLNRTVTFLTVLLAICLALSYRMMAPFFGPALLAVLFAIAAFPLYRLILRAIPRPSLAALITTLLVYLLVLFPLGFSIALMADDVTEQVQALQDASRQEGGLGPFLLNKAELVVRWAAPRLRLSEDYLMEQVRTRAQSVAASALTVLGNVLVGAGASIVDFALAAVMLFFFFRDGHRLRHTIADLMPVSRSDSENLFGVVDETVKANLYGVVGVALVQGALTTIGLLIAGVPSALTWGAIATVFAFVPLIGPPVVWVPATIFLANHGDLAQAIFLGIWGVVVVGLADNILRPMLVGGKSHQYPLLVFLSLLGGTAAFGVMGLFVGPLLISLSIAVFKVLRREVSGASDYNEENS